MTADCPTTAKAGKAHPEQFFSRPYLYGHMKTQLRPLLCCLLWWLVFCDQSAAQTSFAQLNTPLGRMLFDAYQDRQGYIWISSAAGLARYNGTRFQHFTKADGLTDQDIFSVFEDRYQRIWALSFNGRPAYYQHHQWHHPSNTGWLKSLAGFGTIQTMLEWGDTLVLASEQRVSFIAGHRILHTIAPQQMHPQTTIIRAAVVFNKQLLIITDAGFFNAVSKKWGALPADLRFSNQNTKLVVWQHQLCISQGRRVYVFDANLQLQSVIKSPKDDLVLRISLRPSIGNANTHEPDLVICTESSICRVSSRRPYRVHVENNSIPWPSAVFTDRSGNTWVTSLTSGLYFSEHQLLQPVQLSSAIPHDLCTRLKVMEGRLWAGTEAGCLFIQNTDTQPQVLPQATPPFQLLYRARFSESFKRIRALSLAENRVYAAMDGALLIVQLPEKRVLQIPGVSKAVLPASNDSLLVARSARLVKIQRPAPHAAALPSLLPKERVILSDRIFCMERQGQDSVWLGSRTGLKLLVHERSVPLPPPLAAIQVPVSAIQVLQNSALLIGTEEQGLLFFDGHRLRQIQHPLHTFHTVYELATSPNDAHSWWVATNRGAFLLSMSAGQLPAFQPHPNEIPYEQTVYSTAIHQGNVWLATETGLMRYHLNQPPPARPAAYWETLQTDDNIYNLPAVGSISLPHHQNNLILRFTSFRYAVSHRTGYRYRLVPGSNNWQPVPGNGELQLQQLAPGGYRIEIQARGPGTNFGPSAWLRFDIRPPWWASRWFQWGVILLVTGALLLLFAVHLRAVKRKTAAMQQALRQEKEQMALRHQLLLWQQAAEKAQLTPHLIFNAIYALQGYFGAGDIEDGKKYAEKFAAVMRRQLKLAGSERIRLEEEMIHLRNFCDWRNLKRRNPVSFRFECNPTDGLSLEIPTMLLQPLVENCFDHAFISDEPGQTIFIRLHPTPQQQAVEIEMTDNGVGYHPPDDPETASLVNTPASNKKALLIIQKRLTLLATLHWPQGHTPGPLFSIGRVHEKAVPAGCRVFLRIPCSFTPV